ncbi:hypothetical protein GCM10009854_10830 [Saccharopolyspora halophila]|uniref:Uncharacterized protein n=1 Tax=Saccharopolyspora halophila TaxID=405551 RepID=A0ABP5SQT8_9PSEU
MTWLLMTAVLAGCVGVMAPAVRRYLLRRRAVARTRTALRWFQQQNRRPSPGGGYGRHALRRPGSGGLST